MGRDAAVRETKNGNKFVSLTVGVNGRVNGIDKSSWYDIMWFNYSENMVQHLKKGSSVIVTGELDADIEVGSDGVARCRRNVMADSVTFNSTNKQQQDGDATQAASKKTTTPTTKKNTPEPPSDEEISVVSKPATKKIEVESDDSELPF